MVPHSASLDSDRTLWTKCTTSNFRPMSLAKPCKMLVRKARGWNMREIQKSVGGCIRSAHPHNQSARSFKSMTHELRERLVGYANARHVFGTRPSQIAACRLSRSYPSFAPVALPAKLSNRAVREFRVLLSKASRRPSSSARKLFRHFLAMGVVGKANVPPGRPCASRGCLGLLGLLGSVPSSAKGGPTAEVLMSEIRWFRSTVKLRILPARAAPCGGGNSSMSCSMACLAIFVEVVMLRQPTPAESNSVTSPKARLSRVAIAGTVVE
mmetsp:Transcript_108496/g.210060  ORF Transcript_108496/g.210060 Transcript_108496/m.210060 type:complete len:268 (+) Transcript_108496:530-1333(+)